MVRVQVADHGVEVGRVEVRWGAEGAVAEIQQQAEVASVVLGAHEVGRGGRVRAGEGAGAPDDGQPHAGHLLEGAGPPRSPGRAAREVRELVGVARRQPLVRGLGQVVGAQRAEVGQDAEDILGGLLGAGDEGHAVAHDVGDDAGQQRVVRAAEDEGVDAPRRDRLEVLVGHPQQLRPAGDAGLDELDEPGQGWLDTSTCGAAANAST